ncbi:hypothetical protein IC235_09340 [Hymenobacter sp. BT664]|uniref:SMI1/KNR4 family protein n=1 Tax=Hymenobacter montanus TaxID=2771359 RepID=A0A927BDK7_9BACT|nr:hypothetical protein [Hymenobacter montanus]MBD2768092.1 hypothetical protein [Hymenobacter montanus]
MAIYQNIRKLYHLSDDENFGFSKADIAEVEKRLNIELLPQELRSYYLTLGKNKNINYSHNRLLKPDSTIGFSNHWYLIFYKENQAVTC